MRSEGEILKKMGKRLRLLRVERDLTQGEVGSVVGVTQGSIGFYENGNRAMPLIAACNLAEFFNVRLDYLVGLTDIKEPPSSDDEFGDPDLRYIARGLRDRRDAEKLRRVAEVLFPESFKL